MRILGFLAENYMRVRIVEVRPKGRVVQFTGKNGQGKTSAIGAVWAGLLGKRFQPEKPVRKGSANARIQLALGDEKIELKLTRTIRPDGTQSLDLQTAAGVQISQPQQLLNGLMGEMPGDPLEFMKSAPKDQVEILRKLVKLDIDIDNLNRLNQEDFDQRRNVNRDVARLQAEVQSFIVQDGLPKEKVDEAPILAKLNNASALNETARTVDAKRGDLGRFAETRKHEEAAALRALSLHDEAIESTKQQLEELKGARKGFVQGHKTAVEMAETAADAYANATAGEFVDVSALTASLQDIQLTNREIDKRTRRDDVQTALNAEQRRSAELTRNIDARNETKTNALAEAKMPVGGLTMNVDEGTVLFKGIPLGQLGEAEQLRLCALIYMTGNPKLRVLPIWHGEALDDDNLAVLEALCEEHDFQIWMAKVDSSGTVGVVMEDGMGTVVEA